MGKDKTKDAETATSSETNRDHSWHQEARDAAREMAKAHAQYQATINKNCTPTLPTTLKVTSGSNGFRIMDPFNWRRDKTIY